MPVDTTQNYDASSEQKGLGEAGFKTAGDEITRSSRHEARVKDEA